MYMYQLYILFWNKCTHIHKTSANFIYDEWYRYLKTVNILRDISSGISCSFYGHFKGTSAICLFPSL